MASEVPPHEVVLVTTPQDIELCMNIRIDVFHHEQGFPLDVERDEYDDIPTTAHFLLRSTNSPSTPMGTIRAVKPAGKDYYKLTRLALLKNYRQFKLGRTLVNSLHEWVKQDAATKSPGASTVTVVCHSQLYVKGFYARFGYVPEGDEFDEDGDPHQKMVLTIPLV
ncbi:acyl-CoA N-acyltransferase [Cylindrobasidium torrendii FP15055 ss-10]|uniref:Acyl-CoA N-acyltransferase n=1 Tax=Cylindrobasidium torrendii FP15055 ss-10 TaxID=1314674 RepID=A0A0D7BGN9_9AGAR|nr:acyl-CoA N-acyltransferase [Cylindrobasidium torrendii FP15055 ss-10]